VKALNRDLQVRCDVLEWQRNRLLAYVEDSDDVNEVQRMKVRMAQKWTEEELARLQKNYGQVSNAATLQSFRQKRWKYQGSSR